MPAAAQTKWMDWKQIKTRPPFNELFPSFNEWQRIFESMLQNGYDETYPVVIWKGKDVCIDGHCRLYALKMLEQHPQYAIREIPVIERTFKDKDEALLYAVHCQRDRRDMTDADIIFAVKALDSRASHGGNRTSKKYMRNLISNVEGQDTYERIGKLLGIGRSKVYEAFVILDRDRKEGKEQGLFGGSVEGWAYEVSRGRRTIHSAAMAIKKREKRPEPKELGPKLHQFYKKMRRAHREMVETNFFLRELNPARIEPQDLTYDRVKGHNVFEGMQRQLAGIVHEIAIFESFFGNHVQFSSEALDGLEDERRSELLSQIGIGYRPELPNPYDPAEKMDGGPPTQETRR